MSPASSWPMRSAVGVAALTLVGAGVPWLAARRFAGAPAAPCPAEGTVVRVHAASHSLYLCRSGRPEARYPVALGRGGMDKHQEGDGRTPSGLYPLGSPRPSASFHRFIPVGYPTAGQRARGWTGGAIGIHGPDSRARLLGSLTTWVDWTAGCLAVGTTSEIDQIAEWTVATEASSILIE